MIETSLNPGSWVAGRYRLGTSLGGGGAGSTFVAHDEVRGEEVALKIAKPGLAETLERELELLGRISHPHVVPVYDFGRVGSHAYLASKYLRGPSLASIRDWEVLSRALLDVLDGLSFLHELGLRHGDVKSDNVVLDESGRAVLIDLGCAGPIEIVSSGELSGTLELAAPELLRAGEHVDNRADLYAFGVMITRLEGSAGPLPERWAKLVPRLCAHRPSDRPVNVRDLLERAGEYARARAPLPPESPVLLGRDRIVWQFERDLDAFIARREGARAWVVRGEPGCGKTRLIAELARRAKKNDVLVVEARPEQTSPIDSLFVRTLGEAARPGIEGALDALSRVRAEGAGALWVLDDAELLEPSERRRFEAIVRALVPADPIFVLTTSIDAPNASPIELGPLDEAAVGQWADGRIDPASYDEIMELSGGHPATVRWLLGEITLGRERDPLRRFYAARDQRSVAIDRVAQPVRTPIEILAAHEGSLSVAELGALGATEAGVLEASARGWLRIEMGVHRLARRTDCVPILAAMKPRARAALHRTLSAWHEIRPGEDAQAARHALLANERERALAFTPGDGKTWLRCAEIFARDGDPRVRLRAAQIFERTSASSAAVELLRELEGEPSLERAEVARSLAACLLALERHVEALDVIGSIDAQGETLASFGDLACRALIKRGAYDEAIARARQSLGHAVERRTIAALCEDLGVALSYRGDGEARERLLEADRLWTELGGARERVRIASYLAIDAYRRGELEEARHGYERALAIAEEHRLEDMISHAALNLGTVHHQRGDYGPAFEAYRRGHRMAQALGQAFTLATLELDYAQLFADIGLLPRASAAIEHAIAQAERGGFALLLGACASVEAQIAIETKRFEDAERAMARARGHFEGRAERELAEIRWLESKLALARADGAAAARALGAMPPDLAQDLIVRREITLAKIALLDRQTDAAARAIERAIEIAKKQGYAALRAEAHAELARVWTARGAHTLAENERRAAREIFEKIAAGLEPAMRDAFWAHSNRADLKAHAVEQTRSTERERRLTLLLSINRKLSSSLNEGDVLHLAMDAAIELTGAERGFLIVKRDPDGELYVPVARNLDRERIGRSHLKFSRSIAERAIETGEPVVTIDALEDTRFRGNESVHAMKLRSVIAVPIPSPDGVIGAMYLDNRFQRGRFESVDEDLLRAFADQVAIALANAKLHEELARRTAELERERERVLALSQGQAQEIERLSTALEDQRHALERRYDYGALVAQGTAMRPVIATLEKVIDSPLTILVQGESGTGKELVARAAHFNGPRKAGSFVTVNCAALPDNLLESELFGHVRGAFTGADRDREGLMALASGGTLFLDEIGEMSLAMQAKLLRALEQREIRPVGGSRSIAVDFRLVCATNRVLAEEARAGRFREDLYYRVGVVEIRLPPLRERLEDLPELARRIVLQASKEVGRAKAPSIGADAVKYLLSQRWPGNVRQLQNALRAALVMCDGEVIEPRHLIVSTQTSPSRASFTRADRDAQEKARILEALQATDWNASQAAKRAGISRATLYRKLAKLGIAPTKS